MQSDIPRLKRSRRIPLVVCFQIRAIVEWPQSSFNTVFKGDQHQSEDSININKKSRKLFLVFASYFQVNLLDWFRHPSVLLFKEYTKFMLLADLFLLEVAESSLNVCSPSFQSKLCISNFEPTRTSMMNCTGKEVKRLRGQEWEGRLGGKDCGKKRNG